MTETKTGDFAQNALQRPKSGPLIKAAIQIVASQLACATPQNSEPLTRISELAPFGSLQVSQARISLTPLQTSSLRLKLVW